MIRLFEQLKQACRMPKMLRLFCFCCSEPISLQSASALMKSKMTLEQHLLIRVSRDHAKQLNDENILQLDPNKKETIAWFQARGNVVPLGENALVSSAA